MKCRLLLIATLLVLLPSVAHAIPHYSKAYTKRAIRYEAKKAGYGKADTAALVWLGKKESNLRNWAKSKSKTYLGAFQLKYTMCKGRKWWNPHWSTRRAIRYVKHRYKTPRGAKRHWLKYGWY